MIPAPARPYAGCCRCPACSPKPLRTYGEDFRHESEVRHVASLPTRDDRRRYLRMVEARRGEGEKRRIIVGLHELHREGRRA